MNYTWILKFEFFVEAPRDRGFCSMLVPLYLRVINCRVVQPKRKAKFWDIGTIFQTVQAWVLKVGIESILVLGRLETQGFLL